MLFYMTGYHNSLNYQWFGHLRYNVAATELNNYGGF